MQPRIELLKTKKLIGSKLKMTLTQNKTDLLWGGFAPRIKEITNRVDMNKISMQILNSNFYVNFNPNKEFEKWATVEVSAFNAIPNHMETFTLNGGLYAVFDYKGSRANTHIFQYIFSNWLPNSEYQLDDRPHFEILGEKYKNNDPNSEEEIWIPIKQE